MDRADVLSVLGTLAMVAGLALIHPALLLVLGGYVAVTNAAARMR